MVERKLHKTQSFFQQLETESGVSREALLSRWREVRESVLTTGTYQHTTEELEFGARLAWRNNARCIGKLIWRQLVVKDLRNITSPEEVFEGCLAHLAESTNSGTIVPLITIFPSKGPRIVNEQLIRYADDPAQASFVAKLSELGWTPSGQPFQVLPLLIEWPGKTPLLREIPPEYVLQVPLAHPEFAWFEKLGLRWHALPAMSDRTLEIGDIFYPCAPFSGWYMGTEIGARNLADENRYNLLPPIAEKMGLDTTSERTLWKDRALVELNRAVLHSYHRDGVTIVDHHTASRQFMKHVEDEISNGRVAQGEWSWIVPPLSGAATPVFHHPMSHENLSPRFLERQTYT